MLMAHPAVLQNLVREYEALVSLQDESGTSGAKRRLVDIAYTLCVSTGTRDIDAALIAARFHLPGARPEDDSVLR
jgi:hypothetical protein